MKFFAFAFIITGFLYLNAVGQSHQMSESKTFSIKANSSLEVFKSTDLIYDLDLSNLSSFGSQVEITNIKDGEKTGGFGLNKKKTVNLRVFPNKKIMIKNKGLAPVKVSYKVVEIIEPNQLKQISESKYVQFTLKNNSLRSIPLIIPGVMNPNLSPKSESGVSLKIGQKIYYRKGNEIRVVFTVDESLREGEIVVVNDLIRDKTN